MTVNYTFSIHCSILFCSRLFWFFNHKFRHLISSFYPSVRLSVHSSVFVGLVTYREIDIIHFILDVGILYVSLSLLFVAVVTNKIISTFRVFIRFNSFRCLHISIVICKLNKSFIIFYYLVYYLNTFKNGNFSTLTM